MFLAIVEAKAIARQREQGERAWTAWTMAALGRVKKFPKLADIMPNKPKRAGRKTWQEQLAVAHAWTSALNRKA